MDTIRAATSEIRYRQRAAVEKRRKDFVRRRPLRAIDLVLNELEREHVRGHALKGGQLAGLQGRLPEIVGRATPGPVQSARSSIELHGALLDWQEELVGELSAVRGAGVSDLRSANA